MKDDWTVHNGRSNSSPAFERMVAAVTLLLSQHSLAQRPEDRARLVMAQLAHVHGLRPSEDSR